MVKSNLLRGSLLVSIAAVIFLPLYTFLFLHPSFDRLLAGQAEEEAVRFANHLAVMLLPENHPLTRDVVTDHFRHEIEMASQDMQLAKVKLFAPSGEIIYSTDPKEIGEMNNKRYFHEIVAAGNNHTQVVKKSAHSLEGQKMMRDVVETYVPLMRQGRFIGAFELYYDITKSRGKIRRLLAESAVIVFTVALGLLAGVIISTVRARRSILACCAAEEELRKHHDHLEQLVEERTRQIEREMQEKRQVVSSLHDTEAKYRSLVESTEDSIYLVDREYRYLFMNKKHMARMGMLPGQYLGRSYSEFHLFDETARFRENVDRVFETGKSLQNEHKSRRDERYFLQTLSPVKNDDGAVIAITVVSKDITDRKQMEEELRSLSLTDSLTGLYNRRGFLTLTEQYFKIAQRLKNRVSVLYADLDDLKVINDNLGHQEGDKALIEAAGVLRETFRESDIVARIGGDEFVVMPAALGSATIQSVIDRFQANIAAANAREDRTYRLSISFGFAEYDPAHPCSVDELLARGDRMMYEHKKGKNHRG
ncbi:MAG: GGDEF domain-containing protein [Thermodesulfovibrionales bacterium]